MKELNTVSTGIVDESRTGIRELRWIDSLVRSGEEWHQIEFDVRCVQKKVKKAFTDQLALHGLGTDAEMLAVLAEGLIGFTYLHEHPQRYVLANLSQRERMRFLSVISSEMNFNIPEEVAYISLTLFARFLEENGYPVRFMGKNERTERPLSSLCEEIVEIEKGAIVNAIQ